VLMTAYVGANVAIAWSARARPDAGITFPKSERMTFKSNRYCAASEDIRYTDSEPPSMPWFR
jgi:hypothetical protein